MNKIDEELVLLRSRIAELEDKKKKEEDSKQNPIMKLEAVVDEKRKIRCPGPGAHRDRFNHYNQLTNELSYLEPIIYALKDIQGRLAALENVNKNSANV
jgi:hypothetical protein